MLIGNRYNWVAIYNDGTRLSQIESSGKASAYYKDIDRDKLEAFEMWEGGVRVLHIKFRKGQRLIWRRRVEQSPQGVHEICHIIGKQENINGRNYQGIIGLFESDGRVEAAGRFEEGHPWFYPPTLHPDEQEGDSEPTKN